MKTEDIVRMAREAGDADRIDPFTKDGDWVILTPDELERFAALVASAEREACAELLKATDLNGLKDNPVMQNLVANMLLAYVDAIRARGQE